MVKQYVLSEDEYNQIRVILNDIQFPVDRLEPSYTQSVIKDYLDRLKYIFKEDN